MSRSGRCYHPPDRQRGNQTSTTFGIREVRIFRERLLTAFNPIVPPRRIALLIDADNVAPMLVPPALDRLAQCGIVSLRRAYGDWSVRAGWRDTLYKHAIRAIHQPALNDHKNGSDIALAIDAMDLLHEGTADAFAILSSDCDFAPLMIRLRQAGHDVYGLGEAKATAALQLACTRFFEVGSESGCARQEQRAEKEEPTLESVARQCVENNVTDVGRIGAELHRQGITYTGQLWKNLERERFTLSDDHKRVKGAKAPA